MTKKKKNPIGSEESHFKILHKIGSGGSAEVFKAECVLQDDIAGKYIALKKISKSHNKRKKLLQRIQNEIEIHSESLLQNPSIVKYYTSFENEEYWYIVLELCENGSLQEYIKHRHFIPEKEACELIKQVIDGVKCLHNSHIIHRDLSLKNLLLTDKNEVKIADFGLACRYSGKKIRTACGVGTVNFIAPEAFDGYYDYKTDCWSVGCVLYALLYGAPPFNSERKEEIESRIKRSDLSFPPYASKEAKELLGKMLQKKADRRIEIKDVLNEPFFMKYRSNGIYKDNYQKNKDSGMSSLSQSLSLNSPCYTQTVCDLNGRKSARKSIYNEHPSNDGYHNSHVRSTDQYDSGVKFKMKMNYSSSQLTKSTTAFEKQLTSRVQMSSHQELDDPVPSKSIYLELSECKPVQGLSERSSQMHSFKIDDRLTSTKIPDEQFFFSSNYERHDPGINSVHKSYYSQQFPVPVHKRSDSYHSYRCSEKEIQMKSNPTDKKSLKVIPTPLRAERLNNRRNFISKRFYFSIFNDWQESSRKMVYLEFLRSKQSKCISDVYFISEDGLKISVLKLKDDILVSDKPPLPNKDKKVKKFTFEYLFTNENLPKKHREAYKKAKHLVDMVRAKTPKVIIYGQFAKCEMMENTPDPNFEVEFYDGYHITEIRQKITIQDKNKCEVENCNDIQFKLNEFQKMKEDCINVETLFIETCIKSGRSFKFPVRIGRKPDLPVLLRDITNTSLKYVPPSFLNGTVTRTKSFDISKFVDSTRSYNSSKTLPSLLSHEKDVNTSNRKMAEITLDLETCKLVEGKWVVTEYKDGILMYISTEKANEYCFLDVKTRVKIDSLRQPDLINRYIRDRDSIFHHIFCS